MMQIIVEERVFNGEDYVTFTADDGRKRIKVTRTWNGGRMDWQQKTKLGDPNVSNGSFLCWLTGRTRHTSDFEFALMLAAAEMHK